MARTGEADPEPASDVFAADDEVGRDLAGVQWAATPLGPPDGWPPSLRTTVSIMLSSRFPMWMAWGPELTFFCNAAYRRDTLGRKYPWALGRPAGEVWAEIWDDIGPRIEAVLSTGKATWDEALLLFLERSGYPEETYHTFSYSPVRGESGEVLGMLCVVSEETERVVAERRMAILRDLGSDPSVVRTEQEVLAFASRQLAKNLRTLPFTLTYLFKDGRAQLASTSGMPEEHPAAPAEFPIGDPEAVWPAAVLADGGSEMVDLAGEPYSALPSGAWTQRPTRALAVPLQRQGGTPYGFVVAGLNRYRPFDESYRGFVELIAAHLAAGIASARNYEAQQRRAEELAELDRAKTAFFSNISHEFRTPLTLIMGPVDELRGRLAGTDTRTAEELEVIRRNGLRLSKLVNTLLDFSRIEAGRMRARFEQVDLARFTADLASVFRSAVERAGLTLAVECPPMDRPVHVDRDMWEKVVLNLLSNAVKFTFDGSITVSARETGTHAVVTVADTGIGVPADELPRLFERFHRIANARSRSNEGSGIGLALVRELVTLHGGTITADSVEGAGTTFAISLPFGTDHLPPDSLAPATRGTAVSPTVEPFVQEALRWLPAGDDAATPVVAGARGPGSSARVLVADDNADMREYLVRLLTDAGYRVTAVGDGREALDAVRATVPDLLVSDVMMPRLDGLSLVAALRSDPRTESVPVLLLSARAGQDASVEGLGSGADDYLVKPFAAVELLARVRANVELARLRTHQSRWRAALVDSLHEAFFVCDEDGAVIEINNAFGEVLGYGADGLPYTPPFPWWPDEATDPEGHRQVLAAFAGLLSDGHGSFTLPVRHRDGHRLWVTVTFNQTRDPDTGRRVVVGTFRDVTAEHYAIQRDSALAVLSTTMNRATTLDEALAGALAEVKALWRARRVLAALFTGDEPTITSTDPPDAWSDLPADDRRVLADLRGQPMLTPIDGTGAGILLEHPDGPLALWVDLGGLRPFTAEDHLLLSLLAGHLVQGLVRAHQIDQQRETAIALQRAILGPTSLPGGFAVRYEPATRRLEVGGDWYDVITLSDGRIGIVVGDCVGRGLKAASVMGQLRSACRALLLQDASPARALTALDHFAATVPGAACTTVFCGVLDPRTSRLVYSSAGHPPGILAHADGTTHLLDRGRSTPLAMRRPAARADAESDVPVGSTLLLYTDGLVERRGRSLNDGIGRAARVVHDHVDLPLDDLAAEVMTELSPASGYDDDLALLLYRHHAPLDVTFPADPAQLASLRAALRGWLTRAQVGPAVIQDLLVATGEACTNAIEHGHRDNPGDPIHLRAELALDTVRLTVADSGRWKVPARDDDGIRGRGTNLMRALTDHVTISHDASGTTVHMRRKTTR